MQRLSTLLVLVPLSSWVPFWIDDDRTHRVDAMGRKWGEGRTRGGWACRCLPPGSRHPGGPGAGASVPLCWVRPTGDQHRVVDAREIHCGCVELDDGRVDRQPAGAGGGAATAARAVTWACGNGTASDWTTGGGREGAGEGAGGCSPPPGRLRAWVWGGGQDRLALSRPRSPRPPPPTVGAGWVSWGGRGRGWRHV